MATPLADNTPRWLANKREYDKRYKAAHPEKARIYRQRFHATHREQLNAQGRAYYAANRERIKAKRRAYHRHSYAVNREKIIAQVLAWSRTHPEVKQVKDQRRRARKLALVNDLTVAQWQDIKAQFRHCCAYCGKKQQRLTQDHLTPLSKGGGTTRHNIVPACKSCNSKKWANGVLKPVQPLLL
jgi:5-methylcytosine-specific restriction endonuclease McrA